MSEGYIKEKYDQEDIILVPEEKYDDPVGIFELMRSEAQAGTITEVDVDEFILIVRRA